MNNITDNCVLGKWRQKSYAEPTQSNPLEGESVGVPPNVGKVDAKSGCERKYNTDDSRMNRVLRKQKRTTDAEATQSDLIEGKSVGIPPNVEKIDAESANRSVDLEAIKKTLLSAKVSKFFKVSNTPPDVCVDTYLSHNSSSFFSGTTETEPGMLSTNADFIGGEHKYNTDDSIMKEYFCLDTVFKLSNKVLPEDEIKVLEKV